MIKISISSFMFIRNFSLFFPEQILSTLKVTNLFLFIILQKYYNCDQKVVILYIFKDFNRRYQGISLYFNLSPVSSYFYQRQNLWHCYLIKRETDNTDALSYFLKYRVLLQSSFHQTGTGKFTRRLSTIIRCT